MELARRLQFEGARNVLVSMGGDGAFLLTEDQTLYFANACIGLPCNTVGAGDSMVAGFLAGWLSTGDYAAAHRMGAAAGSATAFSEGLASGEEIRKLLPAF